MIHPLDEDAFRGSRREHFRLLLLGQGYATACDVAQAAHDAWRAIRAVAPFGALGCSQVAWRTVVPFYDDGVPPIDDLGIQQTGLRLSFDATKLDAYLAARQVDDGYWPQPASSVWPHGRQGGPYGCLVAILVNGSLPNATRAPGELYELHSSAYPVAVVGVVVTGTQWPAVLVRGLGQLLGSLADEYELTNPQLASQYDQPPALADPSFDAPNMFQLSPDQRTQLVGGSRWQDVIPALADRWPISTRTALAFHANTRQSGQPMQPQAAVDGVQLIEGCAGFRLNVLRGNWDCLMRRVPYDTTFPIQSSVGFCRVCTNALTSVVIGRREVQHSQRAMLNSQQLAFDKAAWAPSAIVTVPTTTQWPMTVTHPTPDTNTPRWACDVSVDGQHGLTIQNVKLFNRPNDPFSNPTDPTKDYPNVMSSIQFSDLSITVDDGTSTPAPSPLNVLSAFSPPQGIPAPVLTVAQNSNDAVKMNIGIKFSLSWLHASGWQVDACMSLSLRGMTNDIDPGQVVQACKLFPQLSLRYRRPRGASGVLPRVRALSGSINVVANNTAPMVNMGGMLGPLIAGFFSDGNRKKDGVYTPYPQFDTSPPVDPGYPGNTVPALKGLAWSWQSGRKLARIEPRDNSAQIAGLARLAYEAGRAPIVPFWSWLFDYGTPHLVEAHIPTKTVVGAYAVDEQTSRGQSANSVRTVQVAYPPAGADGTSRTYVLTVEKRPRQGAYDNIHMSADMGPDARGPAGSMVASAPFCADKCLHLHWRWGVLASEKTDFPHNFYGWGPGRLGVGAGSVPGAPLIPPNQHLDVTASEDAAGQTVQLRYAVTAKDPGSNEQQVFLEQGISFAFNYQGKLTESPWSPAPGPRLLAATVGVPPNLIPPPVPPTIDPAALRDMFAAIYTYLRWFDATVDGAGQVPQIPGPDFRPAAPALGIADLEAT